MSRVASTLVGSLVNNLRTKTGKVWNQICFPQTKFAFVAIVIVSIITFRKIINCMKSKQTLMTKGTAIGEK